MAIKTFTSGQVLTAADTNTYLANSGLVYVATSSNSATSFLQVDNCFTSTYDNYYITLTASAASANDVLYYRLVDGTTPDAGNNYNHNQLQNYTTTVANFEALNASGCIIGNIYGTNSGFFTTQLNIYQPQTTLRTFSSSLIIAKGSGSIVTNTVTGVTNVTTQYEGIRFYSPGGITFTATATVYGFRKA